MKRIFKAAAAIAAVVLALSLFAACDDDDDSSSSYTYTYTDTYDFSSYTKASAAGTGWDSSVDWGVENYYTDKPDNGFLIVFTYENKSSLLYVYSSSDKTNGISVGYQGAGTYAIEITKTAYVEYLMLSYTSGATSFKYSPYAAVALGTYTISDYSGSLYIEGDGISDLAVYYY